MVLAKRDGKDVVDIYESNGAFLRSFERGILNNALAITSANSESHILIIDKRDFCVHVFIELGEHPHTF